MRQGFARQRGIGAIGLLLILAIVVAIFTVAFRLGPSYMSFLTVKSIMTAVAEDPGAVGAPPGRLVTMLGKRLDVNSVSVVGRSDFTFKRRPEGGLDMIIDYEERHHIAFNIDAVVMFEHRESIPSR